jgi:hypothetical protein
MTLSPLASSASALPPPLVVPVPLFSWLSGCLAFVLLAAPLLGRLGLQLISVEVSTF